MSKNGGLSSIGHEGQPLPGWRPKPVSEHAPGIGLRILTGKLTGTYSTHGEGKFFFTMMAAFAELERDIIHERTTAGLAAARAKGRTEAGPL